MPTALCTIVAVVVVGGLVALEYFGRTPVGAVLTLVNAGAAAVWLTVLFVLVRAERQPVRIGRAVSSMLALTLLPAAWLALLYLHRQGIVLMVSALAIVWIADIAAYFTGRAFGKRKLAPRISPGKTWAGVWGALAGVITVAALAQLLVPDAPLFSNGLFRQSWVLGGFVLCVLVAFSIVGDLFESLLKRQAGAKDSGALLPGHGGILDRIDALLPVLPLAVLLSRGLR